MVVPASIGRRRGPDDRRARRWPVPEPTVAELGGGVEPAAAESFAWNLLRRGDVPGARRILQRATGPVGPFVRETVDLAATGNLDELVAAYVANPSGPSNLVTAAVAAESGQALPLAQRLVAEGAPGIEAAGSIQTHLHYGERFGPAAQVGEVVYAASGPNRAQTAFDVACSWSRAGEPERAIRWVRTAVSDGFAAPRLLDGEPDLALARSHPDWDEIRATLD